MLFDQIQSTIDDRKRGLEAGGPPSSGGTELNGHHNPGNSRNEKICPLLLFMSKN
ncbi:hypothetical protein [Roseibium sp.]|uniref:hypothetical protein n=1 Tax=Roseibium sp. TaxID=1936156 RepID=UPI003BAC43E1